MPSPTDALLTGRGLTFRPSAAATVGVELELQILDPHTRDLVPGAIRILDACAEEGVEGVAGEFLLSMFEVKTGVCEGVAEVRDGLSGLLRRVRRIAHSFGYDLAVGATHPFNRPTASAIFPDERYRRIQKEQGWLSTQETIFGLHVHVGVPDAEKAVGLTNVLVQYLPHLLALSANSPFWQGVDTGLASARSRLFRPAAHSGVPQHTACWQDFCDYCALLREGGVIETTKDLYWDILPRPNLGTLEFRICDAPRSMACLLGLTTLIRCLVLEGLEALERRPELRAGEPRVNWLAQENRWLASRYGLQAACVRRPGLPRRSLAEDVRRLVDRLRPVARRLGEESFLAVFDPIEDFETGAARQRRLFRQTGSWNAVVDDMRNAVAGERVPDARPSSEASSLLRDPVAVSDGGLPTPFWAQRARLTVPAGDGSHS